jgi:hypothetical protein
MIGICFGVYVVLAVCFHWMAQPTISGLAVYEPPAVAVVTTSDVRLALPDPSESSVLSESPAPTDVAAPAAEAPEGAAAGVARQKATTKHVARTAVRHERPARHAHVRERRNPWDFAWRPSSGDRPWF